MVSLPCCIAHLNFIMRSEKGSRGSPIQSDTHWQGVSAVSPHGGTEWQEEQKIRPERPQSPNQLWGGGCLSREEAWSSFSKDHSGSWILVESAWLGRSSYATVLVILARHDVSYTLKTSRSVRDVFLVSDGVSWGIQWGQGKGNIKLLALVLLAELGKDCGKIIKGGRGGRESKSLVWNYITFGISILYPSRHIKGVVKYTYLECDGEFSAGFLKCGCCQIRTNIWSSKTGSSLWV